MKLVSAEAGLRRPTDMVGGGHDVQSGHGGSGHDAHGHDARTHGAPAANEPRIEWEDDMVAFHSRLAAGDATWSLVDRATGSHYGTSRLSGGAHRPLDMPPRNRPPQEHGGEWCNPRGPLPRRLRARGLRWALWRSSYYQPYYQCEAIEHKHEAS